MFATLPAPNQCGSADERLPRRTCTAHSYTNTKHKRFKTFVGVFLVSCTKIVELQCRHRQRKNHSRHGTRPSPVLGPLVLLLDLSLCAEER